MAIALQFPGSALSQGEGSSARVLVVDDLTGSPIARTRISLTHAQGEYVQSSDDSGRATFSGVVHGTYPDVPTTGSIRSCHYRHPFAQQANLVPVSVDQRVELLSIVARLAGYDEYVQNAFKQYADAV